MAIPLLPLKFIVLTIVKVRMGTIRKMYKSTPMMVLAIPVVQVLAMLVCFVNPAMARSFDKMHYLHGYRQQTTEH